MLSANVLQTNLVSDLPGVAAVQDANLVNPWGIAESPGAKGSPFWIGDNNSGQSTLYTAPGTNSAPVTVNGLVVSIPTPGDPLGVSGAPTGTLFNIDGGQTGGFDITGLTSPTTANPTPVTKTSAAIFIFATEDGTIVAWNGLNPTGFDPTKAGTYGIIAVDNSGNNFTEPDPLKQTGAVYKGLAIASSSTSNPIFAGDVNSQFVLYVTNFRSGQVEVYDSAFKRVTLPAGAFTDPNLPAGYAPFNIQVLNGKVYVTYALQNDAKHDDVAGAGHGFVDVFNLDGTPFLPGDAVRLISRGSLNSPWGLTIAPASFGKLAGDLIVGNFGDGTIHAFNALTGKLDKSSADPRGELLDPDGEPIQIDGLWSLTVGNGGKGGDPNTLYFTAGLDHETHGLFGSLTPVAPGTPEGPAEAQMLQADVDIVQLDLAAVIKDLSSNPPASTLTQDLQTLQTDLTDLIRAALRFELDSNRDAGSSAGGLVRVLDALFSELGKHGGGLF